MPTDLARMTAYIGLQVNNQLTDGQIQLLINLTSMEEIEARVWARLQVDIAVNSFALYTTGTTTVTQGSPLVTGVGTGWTSALTGMNFRAGISTPGGPSQQYSPIRIDSVQNATHLTLATVYPQVGGTLLGYQIFPAFYSAPGLARITSIRQQISLGKRTHKWFNNRDPYRINQASPATFWAPFGTDHNGNAMYELWPTETNANGYIIGGFKAHEDMVNPTDLPLLPAGIIINKTLGKVSETIYSLTGDGRWVTQRDFYYGRYKDELDNAIEADREQFGVISQVQDAATDPDSGNMIPGFDQFPYRDVLG